MFPITCNAFGDIAAVVQVINEIVKAFDGVRGSKAQYSEFLHELLAFRDVLDEVQKLADKLDAVQKDVLLNQVRQGCSVLDVSFPEMRRFQLLDDDGPPNPKTGRSLKEQILKLDWRFIERDAVLGLKKKLVYHRQQPQMHVSILSR